MREASSGETLPSGGEASEGGVGGPAPDDLTGVQPGPLAPGQEDAVVAQAAQHPLAAAQPREMGEDQIERVLHLEVRIFDNPPIGPPDQPGGEPLAVGAALHRAEAPLPHPLLQHVQLGLTQDTPQAQQQAVVVLARVVHAIGVGDERADAAGQVQQRVPVDVVACQPAGLVGRPKETSATSSWKPGRSLSRPDWP